MSNDKPWAIICDIDGTLAHFNGRTPFEFDKIATDTLDVAVKDIVESYSNDDTFVILCSGREEKYRETTDRWLTDNDVPYDLLLMRPTKDRREDSIVKQEIYDKEIKDNYQILFVLDDRDRVVKMWRSNGLKCLQVAEGNF